MPLTPFHPAVAAWFRRRFSAPTAAQAEAWPAVRAGQHTLLAAPTGSGKTLAAFLAAIDELVCRALSSAAGLPDETEVLYVSPLKALSNDVQKNLQEPLGGIAAELAREGLPDPGIRAWVRTGDTTSGERERMRRRPPHIVVTTPESLYILLTSESGRRMLGTVRTVIVDEIHALAGSKRGAHLALSLERLTALCEAQGRPRPVRVGLSATQKPIDDMARFLVGAGTEPCHIVDTGHVRERDLRIEVPRSPLEAVMANEVWQEVYDRLAELVSAHRTTLIFVNTRRLAERAARFLAERLGEEAVTAHHGSLAREHRLAAEQRLKKGELRALVATASLELGIDIGEVDLVCQLGSPRAVATFLQRVGRSGHSLGGVPKGRLFPLSRDDLVECAALLDAVRAGELDRIRIPAQPLDVLAQQIVAEVAAREWEVEGLYRLLRRAWPYRDLQQAEFEAVVHMLADGFSTRRGRRGAFLHHDAVNGRLRGRRGARASAVMNGGAIPDQFDSDVILTPEGLRIGSLNEDFAFESLPGDIFQLGNTSYRILKVEPGKVYVEDARGQPPNIPFWLGEAPGRTDELSAAVSRLRRTIDQHLASDAEGAQAWLERDYGLPAAAARQLLDYLGAARAALGVLPAQDTVVLERFFDETGDMHLVIHAPFGSRINRAWGLALRKRFCRKFNFELQAAALEDSLVLSLGPTHSFPLEEVAGYLKAATVRPLLVQALLDAPMFGARWRWNANIALAVPRVRSGRRVPAQFQRMDAEDLLAVVFPDQLACLENIVGEREVPDHPLVRQCLDDCLHETMDIVGLERVLTGLEGGAIRLLARDLAAPSPLAQEILNARPYAFLDDAPAEERRTQAVQARRFLDTATAAELGRLDPAAVERVRLEAWPDARTADELHDALVVLGCLTEAEGRRGPIGNAAANDWVALFGTLGAAGRAALLELPDGQRLWVAAERLAHWRALFPTAPTRPPLEPVSQGAVADAELARRELVRSRLEALGPVTQQALGAPLGLPASAVRQALLALEQEGAVMQGRFTGAGELEWCERRLLARMHRYTLNRLRAEIEPVSAADFLRFLLSWQRVGAEAGDGEDALVAVLEQLEGYVAPAAAWEADILPARLQWYLPYMLDTLCAAGRLVWVRSGPPGGEADAPAARRAPASLRASPIALLPRSSAAYWRDPGADPAASPAVLSANANRLLEALQRYGASFFGELVQDSGLLRSQAEEALVELVARGSVSSDSFAGLRALLTPASRRGMSGRRRHRLAPSLEEAGRWAVPRRRGADSPASAAERVEHIARVLLRRYGVVFRKLLEREVQLPPWRELLYAYRRLEARGEIRGGRFVQGFSGEQFALPEAVPLLREVRKREPRGELVAVSAADPLNLLGVVLPGGRLPAHAGNRLLYRDGVPLAVKMGKAVHLLQALPPAEAWAVQQALIRAGARRPAPAGSASPV